MVYPLKLCLTRGFAAGAAQNASSGSFMISSSMASMMPRRPLSRGSMFLAKNAAVAILPR